LLATLQTPARPCSPSLAVGAGHPSRDLTLFHAKVPISREAAV
jgi:hypothetical protein